MNVELNIRFCFQIPDGVQVDPEQLFIDVPVESVKLYEWKSGERGVSIPPIPAKLLEFETMEGYSI